MVSFTFVSVIGPCERGSWIYVKVPIVSLRQTVGRMIINRELSAHASYQGKFIGDDIGFVRNDYSCHHTPIYILERAL